MSDNDWVRDYENGLEFTEHRDGVDWYDAPLPPRRHRCVAQTRGFMSGGFIERCACGATGFGDGCWIERNSSQPHRWWRR